MRGTCCRWRWTSVKEEEGKTSTFKINKRIVVLLIANGKYYKDYKFSYAPRERMDGNTNFMILRYLQSCFIDYVPFLHSKRVLLSHFIYLLFKKKKKLFFIRMSFESTHHTTICQYFICATIHYMLLWIAAFTFLLLYLYWIWMIEHYNELLSTVVHKWLQFIYLINWLRAV